MRRLIRWSPLIAIFVGAFLFALYGTTFRQKVLYDKYNGMTGTVVSAVQAHRSGRYFMTIRLSDGTFGSVNNGYSPPPMVYVNRIIHYNRLLGMSGHAYFIVPTDTRCLIETVMMAAFCFMGLGIFAFYFTRFWIEFTKDK